jgi:predicted AAA+ superfamily ATPase
MFIKAGDLLEAYVYYEACRLEWFDDVQTGYKFKWEFDDVTNEIDCVLTKDYRSILVECKSTKMPDEGFYLTLDSLADHFGIGCKKVLIMVTDIHRESYDKHVSRGKQMDIITISNKNDLLNIGNKLKQIMLSSL